MVGRAAPRWSFNEPRSLQYNQSGIRLRFRQSYDDEPNAKNILSKL